MISKAEACIKNGDIQGAVGSLKQHIRDNPADAEPRIFLFQLLAVMCDWEKALTQLNVSADLDSGALLMAQTCRELIKCEEFRSAVFTGQRAPLVFGEPEPWIATLIQSLAPASSGDAALAASLADKAFADANPTSGTVDGESFEWIADADMRIGPATEVVLNGKYYWVPFSSIAEIALQEPVDLRDLVWIPAEFKWKNLGESVGFIPVRYTGTTEDDQLLLARKTIWNDLGEDYYTGQGQRVWSTDKGDYSILDIRHITFDQPDAESAAADSD